MSGVRELGRDERRQNVGSRAPGIERSLKLCSMFFDDAPCGRLQPVTKACISDVAVLF